MHGGHFQESCSLGRAAEQGKAPGFFWKECSLLQRVLVAVTKSWFPFCHSPAALLTVPLAACAGQWAKQ